MPCAHVWSALTGFSSVMSKDQCKNLHVGACVVCNLSYVTLLSPASPAAAAITNEAGPTGDDSFEPAVYVAGGPIVWGRATSSFSATPGRARVSRGCHLLFNATFRSSSDNAFRAFGSALLVCRVEWPPEIRAGGCDIFPGFLELPSVLRKVSDPPFSDCQSGAMAERNPEGPNPLATIAYCHFDQHVVRVAMTDRGASRKLAPVQLVTCSLSALLEWSPSGESKSSQAGLPPCFPLPRTINFVSKLWEAA